MPGRPQRPELWRRVYSAALTFASLSTSGCGLQQNVRLLYDMWFIFVKAFLSPILVRYLRLLSRVFRPEGPQDFVTSFIIKNQEPTIKKIRNKYQTQNTKSGSQQSVFSSALWVWVASYDWGVVSFFVYHYACAPLSRLIMKILTRFIKFRCFIIYYTEQMIIIRRDSLMASCFRRNDNNV
jgi:hypothetical protein